jgi:hypothetical protein
VEQVEEPSRWENDDDDDHREAPTLKLKIRRLFVDADAAADDAQLELPGHMTAVDKVR